MDGKLSQTNRKYKNDIEPEWSSSNNPPCNAKSQYCGKTQRSKKLQINSFACQLDAENADGGMHLTELFHGFQTIRALEKDVFITHLATPTFATYAQNMMKNETKTTRDELGLVKENLEKLIFNCDGKSRRGSTNTRGGNLLEKASAKNQDEEIAIPPQPCTCGSKDRLPKINIVRNRRTSLRELFQKIKMSEEKSEPVSNLTKTEKDKSSVHLTKKILKEKTIHPCVTAASVRTIESTSSADEKLRKILHMLQRVYPEASAILKKSQNLWKYVTNNSSYTYEEGQKNRNRMLSEDVIIKFPYKAISDISKASRPIYVGDDHTKWNRECWIKSDAEYLILEL